MKKSILIPFVLLALSSCSSPGQKKKSSSSLTNTSSTNTSSQILTSNISVSSIPATSTTTSLTSAASSSKAGSSSMSKTSATSKPTSIVTSSTSSPSPDPYYDDKELLSCGFYTTDVPTSVPFNLVTSYDTSDWVNYEIVDEMPTDFVYIYKNAYSDGPSGHKASPNFYDNELKGLKISNNGIGLQTPRFYHSGEKIEFRLTIASVNNASNTPVQGKDTAYVYCYDTNGKHLANLDYPIKEGTITKSSENTEIKIYLTGEHIEEVSYIEFRLNEKPYKGGQSYNFGIKGVGLKSWTKA